MDNLLLGGILLGAAILIFKRRQSKSSATAHHSDQHVTFNGAATITMSRDNIAARQAELQHQSQHGDTAATLELQRLYGDDAMMEPRPW